MRTRLSIIILLLVYTIALAEEQRYNIPIGNSPQKGPANAPVTIIEFLDYQ
ncbi:MAG: hypothetical protein NTW44_06745 [Nitrospirae bacterium]|nr:hypothetical protein [Nitrospirota bacterium]